MGKKYKVQYMREPKFYKDFYCTGNECPVNCCFGWGIIGWLKGEYEKIVNAQISEELRKRIESAFEPVSHEDFHRMFDYQVKFDEKRKCPMLTENGLCMIQKELGEEYLSNTCRVYPRKGQICGDAFIRTCQTSCMHVLELICNNENSMVLENTQHSGSKTDIYAEYTITDRMNHPAIKYEREIFEFFYELLSDKTHSIETSMVLGGMACQKLDEFVKKGQHDRIPEILKALKTQLNNQVQIEKLENTKPNLSLKANFAAGLLKFLKGSNIYQSVFNDEMPSEEKWNEGLSKFHEVFKDKPFAMRNIALNLYIANRMPFKDIEYSIFDNFCYFVSEMAIVKFLAVVSSVRYERIDEAFYISVAYVDRVITHDRNSIKFIIEYAKAFGITSPAYLMGILK